MTILIKCCGGGHILQSISTLKLLIFVSVSVSIPVQSIESLHTYCIEVRYDLLKSIIFEGVVCLWFGWNIEMNRLMNQLKENSQKMMCVCMFFSIYTFFRICMPFRIYMYFQDTYLFSIYIYVFRGIHVFQDIYRVSQKKVADSNTTHNFTKNGPIFEIFFFLAKVSV